MLYQLQCGKVIELSTEEYLRLSDETIKGLEGSKSAVYVSNVSFSIGSCFTDEPVEEPQALSDIEIELFRNKYQ